MKNVSFKYKLAGNQNESKVTYIVIPPRKNGEFDSFKLPEPLSKVNRYDIMLVIPDDNTGLYIKRGSAEKNRGLNLADRREDFVCACGAALRLFFSQRTQRRAKDAKGREGKRREGF